MVVKFFYLSLSPPPPLHAASTRIPLGTSPTAVVAALGASDYVTRSRVFQAYDHFVAADLTAFIRQCLMVRRCDTTADSAHENECHSFIIAAPLRVVVFVPLPWCASLARTWCGDRHFMQCRPMYTPACARLCACAYLPCLTLSSVSDLKPQELRNNLGAPGFESVMSSMDAVIVSRLPLA